MDDKQLDEKLKEAKTEAEHFFSEWKFKPYRKIVHLKVANKSTVPSLLNRPIQWFLIGKICTALSCMFFLLWIPYKLDILQFNSQKNSSVTGLSPVQQSVTLSDSKSTHLVDFFPLQRPSLKDPCLLAVMWEVNPDGNYRMVYSSLLEDSDKPYLVSTIDFPGADNRLVLISSNDSEQKYLHYRLIGYGNDTIKTFWAQDYVPHGQLRIKDGLLIEERSLNSAVKNPVGNIKASKTETVNTYIVPYEVGDSGELHLPTDHIQLKVDDQLLFIGNDNGKQITISSKEDVVKVVNEGNSALGQNSTTRFHASHTGNDSLILATDINNQGKSLSIEVVK